MEILLFPLFFGMVLVIIVAAAQRQKAAGRAWQQAARTLKLHSEPGGFLKGRKLKGQRAGFEVLVDSYTRSSGKHSTTFTRYRVAYPSLGLGLKLEKQGALFALARAFGSQDIEVGTRAFDDEVVVKGRSEGRIRKFLTPERQKRIHRLMCSSRECTIGDGEIRCLERGLVTQSERIEQKLGAMVRVAQCLVEEREPEPPPLARALEAQRAGELDQALDLARASRSEAVVGEGGAGELDLDARVLEGEVLLAAGRFGEAADVLEQVRRELPEDDELPELIQVAGQGREAQEHPPTPAPIPESPVAMPGEAPAAPPAESEPETAEPTAPALDAAALAELSRELFAEGVASFEAARLFDARYLNRSVRWSGELVRAESYSSDMVFGAGPGTRAVVLVHTLEDGLFSGREIQAVLQLPGEAVGELRDARGAHLTFEGRLLRCDAFMRNLFVGEAQLTGRS